MGTALLNMVLAFIEGIGLIFSPCILPILPIILSGSLTGERKRPYGIIVGFILTFAIIAFFSRSLIASLHIDPDVLRYIALSILVTLGIVMLSSRLTEKFTLLTQRLANVGSGKNNANHDSSFFSGIIFGILVGLIWTPCAGPILAAVIVQVAIQDTNYLSLLTLLAFAMGAGLPMLLIALCGRRIIDRVGFLKQHTGFLRRLLGCFIIIGVLLIWLQSAATLTISEPVQIEAPTGTKLINALERPYPAPEITGISGWINSSPLSLAELRGRVVLIDFWTYSCINCIRTLPYVKDWYAKYHDKGLVIIGVHSPEFQFEQSYQNVKAAVAKLGITYPVALDNAFATWQNFTNRFWPAHYLIDKNGKVVYQHFGEGEYDTTENNIRYLLGVVGPINTPALNPAMQGQTPETYFGFARSENQASPEEITQNHPANYTYPSVLALNQWALQGKWTVYSDKIVAVSAGASVKIHFKAGEIYAVMGRGKHPIAVRVKLNGQPLVAGKGSDVVNSTVQVDTDRLYTVLNTHGLEGELEMIASAPDLELYTLTFGR